MNHSLTEKLFKEYKNKVFGFFIGFLNNRDVAKDLTQDIFVKLLQKEDTINQIEDIDGYIYAMCRNLAFNYLKSSLHHKKYKNYILTQNRPTNKNLIEKKMDIDHYKFILNKSLKKLPKQQRIIFSLNKKDGFSQKEIAKQLGISIQTVRNHLYQANRNLKLDLTSTKRLEK